MQNLHFCTLVKTLANKKYFLLHLLSIVNSTIRNLTYSYEFSVVLFRRYDMDNVYRKTSTSFLFILHDKRKSNPQIYFIIPLYVELRKEKLC